MTKNSMKKDFGSICYEKIAMSLKRLGFVRKMLGVYMFELSPGIYAWVGLNRVRKSQDMLELYPVVGVAFTCVNEITSSVKVTTTDFSPTVSIPLCYLMNDRKYRTWVWQSGHYEDAVTDDLVKQVRDCGLPFIARFASLELLILELAGQETDEESAWITVNDQRVLPAAMFLSRQFDRIAPFLETERLKNENLGGDPDFDLFSDRLLEKVSTSE